MNFDKLYSEYNSYWKTRDLNKAVNSLQSISNYLGSDWTLISPSTALKPENLLSRYAVDNGKNTNEYQTIADTISYSVLLKHYSQYLDRLIQEIVDYEKKLKAMQEKSFFDSLLEVAITSLGLIVPIVILGLIIWINKS